MRVPTVIGLRGERDAEQQVEGVHVPVLVHPVDVPLVLALGAHLDRVRVRVGVRVRVKG